MKIYFAAYVAEWNHFKEIKEAKYLLTSYLEWKQDSNRIYNN